jgi:putative spermidine/putrescine transport system ATP-binding protein
VAGTRLPVDGAHPEAGTKVKVLLRPEASRSRPIAEGTATDLRARGIVRIATFLGSTTRLTLRLADGTEVKADLPSHRAAEFPAGSNARLVPAPRPVLVVDAAAEREDVAEG